MTSTSLVREAERVPVHSHVRLAIAFFGIAGLVVGLALFVGSLTRPFMGIDVVRDGNGSWMATSVDPNGLATYLGFKAGDKILGVNGISVSQFDPGGERASGRTIRTLTFAQNGTTHNISVFENPPPAGQVLETCFYFLLGLGFWCIGAYVFAKRSTTASARLLYILGSFTIVGLVSVSAQERGLPGALPLEFACLLAIGPAFAHLFAFFPERKPKHPAAPLFGYIPSAVVLILFLMGNRSEDSAQTWFRMALLPILSVGLLVGLGSLVYSSLKAGYVRRRQQARIVMGGAVVGIVPFLSLSILPYMATQKLLVAPQVSVLALVALPASIAYALVRHRLFDIDLVIRRSVVYGLMTIVVAVAYMAVMWVIHTQLTDAPAGLHLLALAAVGAIGLVTYGPVRNAFQTLVDKKFYRDRHDYRQVIRSLSASIVKMTDQDEIARFVTSSASDVLGADGACLLLYTKQGYFYAKSAVGMYVDSPKHAALISQATQLDESGLFPNLAPDSSAVAFFIPLLVGGRQIGILCLGHKASKEGFSVDDLSFLYSIAGHAAAALESSLLFAEAKEHRIELGKAYEQLQTSSEELARREKDLEDAYLGMARTLVLTLESRDPYTRGHSERVSRLVLRIAPLVGISGEKLQRLELAARLHDIGKTGVADAVLLKPGEFDPMERAEIERHPTRGVEILRFLDFLKDVLPIIESHHERWDGSGYPHGLKGEEIPLGGRLIAVADSYDAMVSKRPHRAALPHDEAILRLKEGAGTQWDPRIVDAFVRSEDGQKGT